MSQLAPLVALLVALVAEAKGVYRHDSSDRNVRLLGGPELPEGCMFEGRWYTAGGAVPTREACLACACARGALSCRRRACAALPDPPPRRCHVLRRRGACCPELHCPDGVRVMEQDASARFENEDDIPTPASIMHACVEGGSVYSAGSAMRSALACEQCFCLGGARRCVRPRCLPPPRGCRAPPAPGACCPPRYYCDTHDDRDEQPKPHTSTHDCIVNGERIPEGERVAAAETRGNCSQCFCLRGAVRCQPLACAPPLHGCRPLLRPGHCCAHQYVCDHSHNELVTPNAVALSENSLISTRNDDRSFHTEHESTTKTLITSFSTSKNTPSVAATKGEPANTTKVKRKTKDPPPMSTSKILNVTATTLMARKDLSSTTRKLTVPTTIASSTESLEKTTTEQPEATVRIMINGTINCTAELSSTSIPMNISLNDTEKIKMEGHLRTPINKMDIEAFTEYPNDIITDRNANGDFDENESFTINVTSSLRTNNSFSTPGPKLSTSSKINVPVDLPETLNTSKKTKGDYDYDYSEPTLPPSLPNLKIIPFVAADAVVEDDLTSKEETYPMLEREDKFPVYYPSVDTKKTPYATRREDVYPPTQYPVFVSEKTENAKYPQHTQETQLANDAYPTAPEHIEQDFTMSASIGNHVPEVTKVVTKLPATTFVLDAPSINLFSPPVETEGGFIPKGPGLIDEYYAVYPSTPPPVPHLTTSMQIDIVKGECVSGDGRHVLEGDSISLACSVCTCGWGELHCSPRPCPVPPGCRRRPATSSSVDLCCGELVCNEGNKTTEKPNLLIDIVVNGSKKLDKNETFINELPIEFTNLNHNKSDKNIESVIDTNDTDNNKLDLKTTTLKEETTTASLKPIFSTEKVITEPSTTELQINHENNNYTKNESQEYEEEEEEDEGFSFGSVLKLLLSDSYETTTLPPKRKLSTFAPTITRPQTPPSTNPPTHPPTHPPTNPPTHRTPPPTRAPPPPMTTKRLPKPILPFLPMPHHPYVPPKKSYTQNTVNRIDHLVLGEATAITISSPRPASTSYRPVVYTKATTQTPVSRYPEIKEAVSNQPLDLPRPVGSSALPLPGILKLAGCNIYGRMYRVGRIIAELSTPCQECWCTELGVQCNSLKC